MGYEAPGLCRSLALSALVGAESRPTGSGGMCRACDIHRGEGATRTQLKRQKMGTKQRGHPVRMPDAEIVVVGRGRRWHGVQSLAGRGRGPAEGPFAEKHTLISFNMQRHSGR